EIGQEGSHDLALEVYQAGAGFHLRFDYDTGLFGAASIERLCDHYLGLLDSLTTQPGIRIATYSLLPSDERERILFEWSGAGSAATESQETILDLLRHQLHVDDATIALECDGRRRTLKALDRQSTQLANLLLAEGLTEGEIVGVCMPRGFDMVIAMLAIWKAGGVYLPLASDHPQQRLRYMLDASDVRLLIADTHSSKL